MPLFSNEITTLGLHETRDALDNPAIPLNSAANWQMLFGGEPTVAGELINEYNALTITTVYACVRFIAESVASLPLELWERTDSGHIKAVDHPLFYLLTTEPNPEMSAFTWKETMAGSLAFTGNGYSQIERNAGGSPVALWPLDPRKTEPVRVNNKIVYKTSDGMSNGSFRYIKPEDMIHIPLFSFDGLKGISPIAAARQALGLAKAAEKFGARLFGNGTHAAGVMMNKGPKPDQKVQKEIVESWNSQQGGVNQGKTAFLFGAEWSYQQLSLSPEESQFLSTRNFQRSEIAALWRIPPHVVGDTSRLSGNNAEQEQLRIVTDTLRPYLSRFEIEIIRKLMPTQGRKANRYFVRFDVSERLKGDFKTQMEGFAAGVQWGWYNPNDVLRKLGENPGPAELDIYRTPVNMASAKTLLNPEPVQAAAPTQAERNLLGVYTRSYISIYKDAFGRLLHRNKRDFDTVSALFRPVLRSVADTAVTENGVQLFASDPADGYVDDALKAMVKRMAKWPEIIPQDQVDSYAATEFNRAVRSIHIAVSREIAAAKAAHELTPEEEPANE